MLDTETLIALVSSLLDGEIPDQVEILEALADCSGNVEQAAKLLKGKQHPREATPTKKRKRSSRLDDWLKPSPPSGAHSPKRSRSLSPVRPNEAGPSSKPLSVSTSSSSKVKSLTSEEFMTILRPSASGGLSKPSLVKYPPLTLSTPELVAKHTPCTLHTSILPPELACRLFYVMLHESRSWERNKWYLFDRLVESPHRTSFFIRKSRTELCDQYDIEMDEAAQYWYNGRKTGPSPPFPSAMEEACDYIERVVNDEMRKRPRFALEWGGDPGPDIPKSDGSAKEKIVWRANVAASNCYEGTEESVGFHSDGLTYLGPYATIASLSLGTSRVFRLREVVPMHEKETRSARTFNIPLPHNSLAIMHASCQEMFKHAIPPQRTIDLFRPSFLPPPDLVEFFSDAEHGMGVKGKPSEWSSNCRINITFRFFRPDFAPSTTPKCKCGIPCLLRPDMKNRYSGSDGGGRDDYLRKRDAVKYWWTCNAGAQTNGKGCGLWKIMDPEGEGRGPFADES